EDLRRFAPYRRAGPVPDRQLPLVGNNGMGLELRDDHLDRIDGWRLLLPAPDRAPDQAAEYEGQHCDDQVFHGLQRSPKVCCSNVSAPTAAVSVRNTRGPIRTGV